MKSTPWTLAVDPGLRVCGVSLFEGKYLYKAWLAKNPLRKGRGPDAWNRMAEEVCRSWIRRAPKHCGQLHSLVVEVPQVYWRSGRGGNAADLIELAGVVGATTATIPVLNRAHYLPRAWKGQVPKEIHNRRVLKKLSDDELPAMEKTSTSLQHNVVDSIGLGLFYLGRM